MMKRLSYAFIAILATLAISACSNSETTPESATNPDNGAATKPDQNPSTDKGDADKGDADKGDADKGDADKGNTDSDNGKILVAYYSASGHTKRVAEYIAKETGGTLFEIIPDPNYTTEDLNYNDSDSRVSKEHDNAELRTFSLVTTTPENWDSYSTVFIGYPIWWGIAAWAVDNFVKPNDFKGKKVIPFATAASSPLGESANLLKAQANGGDWQEGIRFYSSATESTVIDWVKSLGL